ncbi:hypothetical protein ACQKJC_13025 [Priestia koreensis]|uniref:hypothetical protein n=1 Tax=Priestia koreensis TaxID=284581 RepID=UPI003D054F0D
MYEKCLSKIYDILKNHDICVDYINEDTVINSDKLIIDSILFMKIFVELENFALVEIDYTELPINHLTIGQIAKYIEGKTLTHVK